MDAGGIGGIAYRLLAVVVTGGMLMAINAQAAQKYILVNVTGGRKPDEVFAAVSREFKTSATNTVRVGIGAIFSYLNQPRARTADDISEFLKLAQQTDTPVLIQIDGENWWGDRPDLWNWWDRAKPGYSPANRANVEWCGWDPTNAVKIAWRNWGCQIRVLPPPNLMSPAYRDACHKEMAALVPIILKWWHALPGSQKDLFVGIKVGWESSIGVNAWYYPNGNSLLDKPAKDDPTTGLNHSHLPDRGVAALGYSAVKTAGLRNSGELTEADVAEVVRRHLADLCREMARLGVPRDKLFTHGAGWKSGERLYQAAVNSNSCPGWSCYQYAADPQKDIGIQDGLKNSDAPYWAAVEWFYQGPSAVGPWRKALETTLAEPRCRFLCIYNWESIMNKKEVLEAIRTCGPAGK